jgi:FlaA1/EpsC-like NDP-sugar epimerase
MFKGLVSIGRPFARLRSVTALTAYSLVLAASFYLAYEIRFDFNVPPEFQEDRIHLIAYVLAAKLVLLVLSRQTGSVLRYFSIPDLVRIAGALGIVSALMVLSRWVNGGQYLVPRGVMLVDLIFGVGGICAFRLGLRVLQERLFLARRFPTKHTQRIAIVGAGNTGASLAKDLLNMPARGLKPVAFLDDDERKHGTFIHGIEIIGRPECLAQGKVLDVAMVVVAMPSAPQKRVREIALALAQHGYKIEIVPALEDLASGRAKLSRIRPVQVEDLLGREEVELDHTSILGFLRDKTVMVTGAGGSIGSELCRQIAQRQPRRLLLVDQSEPSLFLIEQELTGAGYGGTITPLVADILDQDRMHAIFAAYEPQVVFHAAAHKHVYMMERQPSEAIKNNAVGTRKLAEMAIAHQVEAFVLISTDKAVNPTNAMGASKRLAELHLQALHAALAAPKSTVLEAQPLGALVSVDVSQSPDADAESVVKGSRIPDRPARSRVASSVQTKLMAVRFGNVLGSSGSVVPIFKRQIEAGGPVTVTHPDVTRYFMTIPEAAGLVLQASVLGHGGEIFVLDMGQPMKIVDLARQMIELSGFRVGDDIEIKFSGLKPGEKLYEEVRHQSEDHLPTDHPRIMRFVGKGDASGASRTAVAEIEPLIDGMSATELKKALKAIIPEYIPCLE